MLASGMHQQYSPKLDQRLKASWHSEWIVGYSELRPGAIHFSVNHLALGSHRTFFVQSRTLCIPAHAFLRIRE